MSDRSSTDASIRPWEFVLLLVVAIVLLAPTFAVLLFGPMGVVRWDEPGRGWATGSTAVSVGVLVVWLALLAGGLYFAHRAMSRADGGGRDRAVEELRVAYARGEIDREEFEERLETLERGR